MLYSCTLTRSCSDCLCAINVSLSNVSLSNAIIDELFHFDVHMDADDDICAIMIRMCTGVATV